MASHCSQLHGIEKNIDRDQLQVSHTEHLMNVYKVRFPTDMQLRQCPFPGCPGMSRSRIGLQNHFRRLHWGDRILIMEDQPEPFMHCEKCGQQFHPWLLNNHHYNSEAYRLGQECLHRRETLQRFFKANRVVIRVNLDPPEATTSLPYLR